MICGPGSAVYCERNTPILAPTLAAEKLLEMDGIKVSSETLRQMQIGLRLWKPKTPAGETGVPVA